MRADEGLGFGLARLVDIQCGLGGLMLPVEVKGQWHPALWSAAATQLDRLYARDWRAERRGIYLVLWFGRAVPPGKRPKAPPAGIARPETAAGLADALRATLPEGLGGRIAVAVRDVTGPAAQ